MPVPEESYEKFAAKISTETKKPVKELFKGVSLKPLPLPLTDIQDLFSDNFIIGEATHLDFSPKNFLIQHMRSLKAAGFDVLFLEHFFYDDQRSMDQFDPCPKGKNQRIKCTPAYSETLNRLVKVDTRFSLFMPFFHQENPDWRAAYKKNNFRSLVEAAKEAGIRVVGIDTKEIYEEQKKHKSAEGMGLDDNYRIKSMNYAAAKIIEKEMQGTEKGKKWMALMGCAHVKGWWGVPGVAELTGTRTVLIRDNKEKLLPEIQLGGPRFKVEAEGKSQPDLDIQVEVILEQSPYKNFPDYMKEAVKIELYKCIKTQQQEKETCSFWAYLAGVNQGPSAAQKVLDLLDGKALSQPLTERELEAARDGDLGEIIRKCEKAGLLPAAFTMAENSKILRTLREMR